MSSFRRNLFSLYNDNKTVNRLAGPLLNRIPKKFIYGKLFELTYENIKLTEFSPFEEHLENTKNELIKIFITAFNGSSYYRKLFQDCGINDIREINPVNVLGIHDKLPFSDKDTIKFNFKDVLIRNSRVKSDYISTGGTSGEPFFFYINSDRSAKEWAFMVDQWSRAGYSLNSKKISFRGKKISGLFEDDIFLKERRFSSFRLNEDYIEKIWQYVLDYAPEFLYAYPSGAYLVAKYVNNLKLDIPVSLKGILIGSENVVDYQRDYIEKVTNLRTFAWYGHSEKLILAGECEHRKIYHAYPQYGYVQFFTENGTVAESGDFAEITGTGFINSVMPFIKYRTGDWCTYLGNYCEMCGRNYPVFGNVQGRWQQEVLIGKNDTVISYVAINIHTKEFENVIRYQFFQDEAGKATLNILPSDEFTEKDLLNIRKVIGNKINERIALETKIVDDIPLTKSGKYKFIDQKLKISKYF